MTDHLSALSYLFAPLPEAGRAMARLEIVTSGGQVAVSFPEIRVEADPSGYRVSAEADGRTWTGAGDSTLAAVMALLAGRIGLADARGPVVGYKIGEDVYDPADVVIIRQA